MKFYTKRSDHYSNGLYNFLWIMQFTLILITGGVMQVSATAYKHQSILNHKMIQQDSVTYKGKVTDEKGNPIPGATVKITGDTKMTLTTEQGDFFISGPRKGNLEISYIGYLSQQLTLNGLNPSQVIIIRLTPGNNMLGEINIVSNGYQDIQRERTTGSFEVISKEYLQHSADLNLVKRLEGITSGIDFNNNMFRVNSANSGNGTLNGQLNNSPISKLTIRGKNSIDSKNSSNNINGQPLIVIDGVANPYSIDNINPNDVESITILKDASAASIWGSKAGNGVIVVKTNRGNYEKPLGIFLNTNFNISDKIDPFYRKTMTTSEFIDAQFFQFNAANTSIGTATTTQPQPFYSPVAEILNSQKTGQITPAAATAQLDALRANDVRNDFDKYLFRSAYTQSYLLGIDGGGKKVSYRVSAGYDKIRNNSIFSGGQRLTLSYNTSLKLSKNLEATAYINYSERKTNDQAQEDNINGTIGSPFYLYTRLADDQGLPLKIPYKYRPAFVDLLSPTFDLKYVPLQNINEGYTNTRSRNLNFNLGANYRFNHVFSANVLYNYNKGNSNQYILNRQNSFYTRDLITFFTTSTGSTQVPVGGIYRPLTNSSDYQTARTQLNIDKNWGQMHVLNAIAGIEATQTNNENRNSTYYGYNERRLTSNNNLNFSSNLNTRYNDPITGLSTARIPFIWGMSDYQTRTASWYANAAYTYNRRYTITGSIRRDLSSEFDAGNMAFYALGGRWNISNENFYGISFLPKLQLRATFGYNGNVNGPSSGQPIVSYVTYGGITGLPSAVTGNFSTNSQFRPDKTQVFNFGMDFGFKNNRISGSLEYYDKHTKDLIATNTLDPITGAVNRLLFNTAKLHSYGADMMVNSENFQIGLFSWSTNLLFSYNRVKVEDSGNNIAKTAGAAITESNYNEGYDLTQLFAYRWGGLDPFTGNPKGYINGLPVIINNTSAYTSVANRPLSEAHYFGSAVPVYYGSLRNTLRYGAFSISASLLYKLGYYFRRPVSDLVQYSTLFNNGMVQGAEYSQRWQKQGDERSTNVPSQLYPANRQRDIFYQYAEINVQKADHIRLQEVNLSYTFNKKQWFLKNTRVYTNISNLGIIWRANKLGLDPEVNDYPNPRTYAFGLSANF